MKKIIFIVFLLVFSLSFAEEIKGWCGTLEALQNYRDGKTLQRPNLSGPVEYIERTNLRVHFTRSGEDACDSSYAIRVANATEYSRYKQVDTLLWKTPPPDYGVGGDDRYDVYIGVMPSGVAGMCVTEYSYPDPYPDGATSFIAVGNQLESEFLKVVCAHEFSHACQMRYSAEEMGFIYENTSVYMEDVCYEDNNSYTRFFSATPNPLANPEYPINSTENNFHYAGGIWFMFLDEYYDRNCPRRVWERLGEVAGRFTLNGIDDVLRNNYSSNLSHALKHYGLWRYFVCTYADTINYFAEGFRWPLARILRSHYDYPCQGNQNPYPLAVRGGTSFVEFQNGANKLSISFDGQDGRDWGSWIVGYREGNSQVFELQLDSASAAGSDSFDWQDFHHFAIVSVIGNWESPGTGITFDYTANCRILKDVAVQSIVDVPASSDSGNVVTPKAWIKNYGISQETFPAYFRFGPNYNDMHMVTIGPGDSTLQEFTSFTLLTRGNNDYSCTLALAGDERAGNNLRTGRTVVWVKDVGVLSILDPVGTIGQGEWIRPKARLKNFGNYSALFDVLFWIGNWNTTKRISLGAGSETDVLFDSLWYASDTGQFFTKCSTAYSADMNRINDKIEGDFFIGPPGIEENTYSFPFPPSSKAEFEIYNALGKKIDAQKGKINFSALSPGVYFLKIQDGEKEFKRKIMVIR